MARPTAWEAAQKTGFLGGLGSGRHRMAMTPPKPPIAKKSKPKKKALPKESGPGFQTDNPMPLGDSGIPEPDSDAMDLGEGDDGGAPHKGGIGITIAVHPMPAHKIGALRKMQKGR